MKCSFKYKKNCNGGYKAVQEARISLMGKLFPLTVSELDTWGHPRRGSTVAAQKEKFSLQKN